jgi:hypothetical protein
MNNAAAPTAAHLIQSCRGAHTPDAADQADQQRDARE